MGNREATQPPSAAAEGATIMPLTITKKLQAVVTFLHGLRSQRVAELLAPYGFTDADGDEGRTLLMTVLAQPKWASSGIDASLVQKLDAWENQWFPITRLVLANRFPEVNEWFFKNLAQAEGIAVVVSVSTWVRRYRLLASGTSPVGAIGKDAVAALNGRGITEASVAAVEAELNKLGRVEVDPNAGEAVRLSVEAAEARLWSWYKEWRGVARHAIRDGRLLRGLGLAAKPARGDEVVEEDLDEALAVASDPATASRTGNAEAETTG